MSKEKRLALALLDGIYNMLLAANENLPLRNIQAAYREARNSIVEMEE